MIKNSIRRITNYPSTSTFFRLISPTLPCTTGIIRLNHERALDHVHTKFRSFHSNNHSIMRESNSNQVGGEEEEAFKKTSLPAPVYTSSTQNPAILALKQTYIRHRTILWLTLMNLGVIYIPVIPPTLKLLSMLGSIIFGYTSKRNNRNSLPVLVKSITFDLQDRSKFVLERFDGKRDTVPIRDIVMDHEALFKVYMPFGSFFWRSFLLNKTDMRSHNELKFMVVKIGDSMRENTENLQFNSEGEVVRTVYTLREGDEDNLESLREHIERIRALYDPPHY